MTRLGYWDFVRAMISTVCDVCVNPILRNGYGLWIMGYGLWLWIVGYKN